MKRTAQLPDDPALPGLQALRERGVAGALPSWRFDAPVELTLCGYTPGSRATIEVRAGRHHFAVKAYARDAMPEVQLYGALAEAGLAGDGAVRVPPLLSWNLDLRVLAIGWLEGSPANELLKQGRGERAGALAAAFVRRVASLGVSVGPPFGASQMLREARHWAAELDAADGAARGGGGARTLADLLAHVAPPPGVPHLVHGTLYLRHILDLGDAAGVIDWQRFGQGPLELDAGMFLATVSRRSVRHEVSAGDARRAEDAFLEGTAGLLERRALAWYRAAALLHLARRLLKRRPADEAHLLLVEAVRLAEAAL